MVFSIVSFYLRLKWFIRCLATMFLLEGEVSGRGRREVRTGRSEEGQENESWLTDVDLPAVEEVAAVALEMALLEAVEPVAAGERSVYIGKPSQEKSCLLLDIFQKLP